MCLQRRPVILYLGPVLSYCILTDESQTCNTGSYGNSEYEDCNSLERKANLFVRQVQMFLWKHLPRSQNKTEPTGERGTLCRKGGKN